MRHAIFCGAKAYVVNFIKHFLAHHWFVFAFNHLAIQNSVRDQTRVKGILKDFINTLLVGFHTYLFQHFDDVLVLVPLQLPFPSLSELLAVFIQHDLSLSIDLDRIISDRGRNTPFSLLIL
ncbi:MAG: hypothetical protein IT233_10520 [Bacteroidia bacterium]|nr:hypothetical protein [Bacteroidia bacterium]